jgi:N-acetylglucosamine kinase-like BadF-type ATPase
MLIIADGGSTKTDWRITGDDGQVISATSTGFNPNYNDAAGIMALIKKGLKHEIPADASGTIYYYGAGCWDEGRAALVQKAFNQVFPKFVTHVSHDILAAALATCGNQPGIACILGTGSNSVLFDGLKVVDNVTNLGFLLGDEGSGSQIGRKLVKSYFYREMPAELHPVIEAQCPAGRKEILDRIYEGPMPAAYLASFAHHFSKHQKHPFVKELIKSCFEEFVVRHVCKYENHENLPIHFIGSVAYHFQTILQEVLRKHGLKQGHILMKPIGNLLKYHLEKSPVVQANPSVVNDVS